MTETTAHDEHHEHDLGALAHMVTFEEIDDAITTIERVLEIFETKRQTLPPYYAQFADPDAGNVTRLEDAIGQLRTARSLHAIPEAALEAALAAAGYPLDDEDEDDEAEDQGETRQVAS